jgi:hypothetical protein
MGGGRFRCGDFSFLRTFSRSSRLGRAAGSALVVHAISSLTYSAGLADREIARPDPRSTPRDLPRTDVTCAARHATCGVRRVTSAHGACPAGHHT